MQHSREYRFDPNNLAFYYTNPNELIKPNNFKMIKEDKKKTNQQNELSQFNSVLGLKLKPTHLNHHNHQPFGFSIVSFPHKRNTNPFSLYFLNLPMNIMEKHQISSWPQAKSQAYEVNSIDFQFCTHKDIQNQNGRLCFNELIWFNECTSTATHSLVQCYLIYLHNLLPDIWT